MSELEAAIRVRPGGLLWQDEVGRTLLHVAAASNSAAVIDFLASLNYGN